MVVTTDGYDIPLEPSRSEPAQIGHRRQRGSCRASLLPPLAARSQPTGGISRIERLAARGTPAWSPDGKRIVVGGDDGQGPGLFAIQVESGTLTRVVSGEAYDPVWSPDGGLIVYTFDDKEEPPCGRCVRMAVR